MMPWLTSNCSALELAFNSTGKVRNANRDDEPNKITPAHVRDCICSISPATNSHGAILEANCTTGTMYVRLHRQVILRILNGMPRFVSGNSSRRDTRCEIDILA